MTAPTTTAPVYAVRVDFTEGDHAFWGYRPDATKANRLRRRLVNSCPGWGIRDLTVVAMTEADWRAHRNRRRCISLLCPAIQSDQPGWASGQPDRAPTSPRGTLDVPAWL